ncbi:MAG: hypothetical protein DRN92_04690 [Thermoproteota archaeon]|nr:MAG: hypothetical protein DRN92_04690 [Candidatus Korarchaeota archaeon]
MQALPHLLEASRYKPLLSHWEDKVRGTLTWVRFPFFDYETSLSKIRGCIEQIEGNEEEILRALGRDI